MGITDEYLLEHKQKWINDWDEITETRTVNLTDDESSNLYEEYWKKVYNEETLDLKEKLVVRIDQCDTDPIILQILPMEGTKYYQVDFYTKSSFEKYGRPMITFFIKNKYQKNEFVRSNLDINYVFQEILPRQYKEVEAMPDGPERVKKVEAVTNMRNVFARVFCVDFPQIAASVILKEQLNKGEKDVNNNCSQNLDADDGLEI